MEIKSASFVNYIVRQFINDILNEYGFFSERGITIDERKWNFKYKDYFQIKSGCSKVCLLLNNKNYVVKIPLIYNLDKEEEENLKKKSLKYRKDGLYLDAFEELEKENLCEAEVVNYENAKEVGVEKFFAEEEKFIEYHGVPVYIQKKVMTTYSESAEKVKEIEPEDTEILDIIETKTEINNIPYLSDASNFLIDLYKYASSEEEFIDLIDFIYQEDINDLHDENFGYDYEGNPVFFDYSGF